MGRKRNGRPMHELSLAQGLLGQLTELVETHKASSVLTVRVNIGSMAGIVVDSFVFGFDAIKVEYDSTKFAELEIEKVEGDEMILAQVVME